MPELTSFLISDLDVLKTAGALWSALQEEDQHLPDLEQDGTGELAGAHLQARYVRDRDLPLFAVEVVDLRRSAIWEAGVMNIGREAPAAFWRVRAGQVDAPAAWTTALEGKVQTPLQPKYRPTFLSVLTAFHSSSGAVLVENIAQRAAVEEELAYWRELARAQALAIKRLTADAHLIAYASSGLPAGCRAVPRPGSN